MVDQKTQEKDCLRDLRQARQAYSRGFKVACIKTGVWLLLIALYVQGFCKIFNNHLGTEKFYDTEGIHYVGLGFAVGLELACVLTNIFFFAILYGIGRCFRPLNPRLFDCICVHLDWVLNCIGDLLVSLI